MTPSDPAAPPSPVALDSGPLGMLSNPNRRAPATIAIANWLEGLQRVGVVVILPEIVDYEVRREIRLRDNRRALRRLDDLRAALYFYPVDSAAWLRAAEMWAIARRAARPTAAPKALDADMILCAQAEQLGATVATDNVGHLARFVPARRWEDIPAVP